MKESMEYPPGKIINDKFEVIERIAVGSTGADIYSGRHITLDRDILIKILPPSASYDNTLIQRFLQEIKLTAALQHPNILPAFEAGEIDGRYYLVTAYEKGFYLNDYIEHRGYLEEKEALKMLLDLCKAMKYAWDKERILHRNIKPASIWVAAGNLPMITDFGMAKATDNMQHLTLSGTTIGNPMYMSPEQAKGAKDLDFRADIYCLGLVLYYTLTGHDPYSESSPLALLEAQITKMPEAASKYGATISKKCLKLLDQMIAKDKNDRYHGWDLLIDDINRVLGNEATSASALKKSKAIKNSKSKKKDAAKAQSAAIAAKQSNPVKWIIISTAIILVVIIAILAIIL